MDQTHVGNSRSALLQAAISAIVSAGWLGAGARLITAQAGVPLGALNYHFGSKEALLRQAAMAEIQLMFRTPAEIIAQAATLDVLIEGMVHWATASDTASFQQLLLLETITQARRDPLLAADLAAALGGYRLALAQAIARVGPGGIDQGAIEDSSSAFAAHCNGLWLQTIMEPTFPGLQARRHAIQLWTEHFARPPQP